MFNVARQSAAAAARANAGFLNESNRIASAAERLRQREARAAAREASRINAAASIEQALVEDTFDEAANASASDRLLATLRQHHAGDTHA